MGSKNDVMLALLNLEDGDYLMPRTKTKNVKGETPGQRLAQLRKERGLTQADLAAHLEITQTAVSDYENDVCKLSGPVIIQLSKILKVSADELLGLKKTKSNGQVIRRAVFKRIQKIETLPKRDQQSIFRTIDAYLQRAT